MTKFVVTVLILALGYFAFLKRTEPPKEIKIEETAATQAVIAEESATEQIVITARIPIGAALSNVETPVSAVTETAELDNDTELITERDEPKDNVDQTVIANEKKLAAAKTGPEVFELLQKLRIRMKKLSEISTVANTQNYARFFGTYEGPVVNRRQESVYTLKIVIKQNPDPAMPTIFGNFEINKGKDGIVKADFNGDFGMQLVGRDGLVISDTNERNNFQLYKLDNGMVAGTYYERRKASYRAYKFILKNK